MKRLLSTALFAALVASSAHAQSVGEKTGVNSMTGVAPSTQDFVTEAGASDMFEIQSSQMAQAKGGMKEKTFASRMIDDHTKTSNAIKGMVASGKVKATLPTQMSSGEQSMLDKLKGLDGADFNKQFWSDQQSAHKDAVSLYERYGKSGENDGLKKWAEATLPTLRDHLTMANNGPK